VLVVVDIFRSFSAAWVIAGTIKKVIASNRTRVNTSCIPYLPGFSRRFGGKQTMAEIIRAMSIGTYSYENSNNTIQAQ
jgi:hypothetical protein